MPTHGVAAGLIKLQDELEAIEKTVMEQIRGKEKMVLEKPKETIELSQLNRRLRDNPIAVVGMSSIFPQSENLQDYWDKIIREVDCITEVPESRWNIDDYYDPNPKVRDKTYCKRGGFIPDIEFNPVEFGLPPNLLEVTDVSQLLALVVAKNAMNDAGYGSLKEFDRSGVGVILGAASTQLGGSLGARLHYPVWKRVLTNCGLSDGDSQQIIEKIKSAYLEWTEDAFPGMLSNVIAGRIANRLDFGGINFTVDAACASSLAAVKMAVNELVDGNCNMVLTGGVDADNSVFTYLCFSKTPALSKRQETRPFDVDADGMMMGEGVGMLVLKRLKDAERDGDRIYSLIRGVGTSSDGKFKSIYAPRPAGQVRALAAAYEGTGITPDTVGLIEAHGTGTMAGDPSEVEALKTFFTPENAGVQQIALGSVKSQIGHTKAAAGAASMIKVSLALHHKILPATINVTKPNPRLGLESSAFYLNTETRPWIRSAHDPKRRAGVNSFGFGGTNYHVVLEEYQTEQTQAYRLNQAPQIFLFSASTAAELVKQCEATLQQLQSKEGLRHYAALVETCKTLKIPANVARIGFVATSLTEACQKLQTGMTFLQKQSGQAWEHPQGIYYRPAGLELQGKVVALFPGQGSQYLGMGREVAVNYPEIRSAYSHLDGLMVADGLERVSEAVFPRPVFEEAQRQAQEARLRQTEYAQPAIAALSAGLYTLLKQAGFKPDFVAGHSFGELTALWAAGVLSNEDYFFLVKSRGQAMAATPGDAGAMLAVTGAVSIVEVVLRGVPGVIIANQNSGTQVVLAGIKAEIMKLKDVLESKGLKASLLPVSAAFHTSLVAHAQKPFAQAIESVKFNPPQVTTFTNVTANAYPADVRSIQKTLQQQLVNPVQFKQEIENLYAAGGYCFVEIGPRSVLTHLVKDILGNRPHLAIALNSSRQKDSDYQLREALVQLRVAGLALAHIDPYQLPIVVPEPRSSKGFYAHINGRNHVSDKTKAAFDKAMGDGFRIQQAAPVEKMPVEKMPVEKSEIKPFSSPIAMPSKAAQPIDTDKVLTRANGSNGARSNGKTPVKTAVSASPVIESQKQSQVARSVAAEVSPLPTLPRTPVTKPMTNHCLNINQTLGSSENGLAQFYQHQAEVVKVHQQYLSNQSEYAKIAFQLVRQQSHLIANMAIGQQPAAAQAAILNSVENSMARFHEYQSETLRVYDQSLNYHAEYSKNLFHLVQQQFGFLSTENVNYALQEFTVTPARSSRYPQGVAKAASVETAQPMAMPYAQPVAYQNGNGNGKHNGNGNGKTAVIEAPARVDAPPDPLPPSRPEGKAPEGKPPEAKLPPAALKVSPVLSVPPVSPYAVRLSTAPIAPKPTVTPPPVMPPVAPAPPVVAIEEAPQSVAEIVPNTELSATLVNIVSEKTGYPVEMLELDMDMEADLGIDSIKRVEILGSLLEQFPDIAKPDPEAVVEIRTLAQVVETLQLLMGSSAPVAASIETQTVEIKAVEVKTEVKTETQAIEIKAPQPVAELAISTAITDRLGETLVNIVSEKTGYPVEMLELDMDMEADLGIDSIKRVEILGSLLEQFPDIARPDPEAVVEIRTLAQVVETLQLLMGSSAPVVAPTLNITATSVVETTVETMVETAIEAVVERVPTTVVEDEIPLSPTSIIPRNDLSETLINIVSEKTGYPVEMLELDMDMEADLGIDSIKRVEILGTLLEQFPNMPKPDPEAVIEIRTLEQVVEVIAKLLQEADQKKKGSEPLAPDVVDWEQEEVLEGIQRSLVKLKPLPAPDFLEFSLPQSAIALVTDDGSMLTANLVQSLTDRGIKAVVLSFPTVTRSMLPPGTPRLELQEMTEAHLATQLAAITATYGNIAAFFHLHPLFKTTELYPEAEQEIVKQVFFMAKHLKAALTQPEPIGSRFFYTVARLDGAFGLEKKCDFGAIAAGLFGLTKTLNMEWNDVTCRAIDISPALSPEQSTQCILAELHDPDRCLVEVAYGSQGRVTIVA
jgi:acyl transferase domain-containing protein